jgi:hypothetical protein
MTTALEAAREELATLRMRVDRLEQAEAILSPAHEPTDPRQPKGPRPTRVKIVPRRAPRRSIRQGSTRTGLRKHIIAHGPLTRGELVAALGCNPNSVDNSLRRLLADGEIAADGRPGARLYRAPDAAAVVGSVPTLKSSKINPLQPPPERGVYPMYDAIVDLDGGTTEQLSKRTGLPTSHVVEQGRRLMQLGLIRFTGVGRERMWLSTSTETVRDAV